jgi:type II secretory pathway pseudopilin PulG
MIEVLVTTVLVAVAIVGVMGGIRSVEATQAKANTADLLMRLAAEKLDDSKILADPADGGSSGDFSDRGYPNITWALTETSTSVTSLDEIVVTVTDGKESQSLDTMLYIVPAAGTTTSNGSGNATTTTAGSGTP